MGELTIILLPNMIAFLRQKKTHRTVYHGPVDNFLVLDRRIRPNGDVF